MANHGRRRNEMGHSCYDLTTSDRRAWNAGKKVGTKRPLKPRQIWAIRFFLDRERRLRDRALFDLERDEVISGRILHWRSSLSTRRVSCG
ncbi:hypothetical protein MPLA_770001 [Mesorhizobium sp. ORS 3359]|nr:hypothetical protein MPLA_770001 [Mesorhizobium sp. ORS 3359]